MHQRLVMRALLKALGFHAWLLLHFVCVRACVRVCVCVCVFLSAALHNNLVSRDDCLFASNAASCSQCKGYRSLPVGSDTHSYFLNKSNNLCGHCSLVIISLISYQCFDPSVVTVPPKIITTTSLWTNVYIVYWHVVLAHETLCFLSQKMLIVSKLFAMCDGINIICAWCKSYSVFSSESFESLLCFKGYYERLLIFTY